jgi:Raf kinase inhibitor-like YbhB/YbcL family protein
MKPRRPNPQRNMSRWGTSHIILAMKHTLSHVILAVVFVAAAAAGMGAQQAAPPPAGAAGGQGAAGGRGRGPAGPPFAMSSSALTDLQILPAKYGCAATPPNVSPPISWANPPAATQSFALTIQDLEPRPARGVQPFPHWWIWNIPATATGLSEGVANTGELPDGSRQTPSQLNGVTITYRSPCPPAPQVHHYMIDLFALDTKLDTLASGASRDDLNKAMDTHVVGHTVMVVPFHQ